LRIYHIRGPVIAVEGLTILVNQVKVTPFHQRLRVVEPDAEIIGIVVGENILVENVRASKRQIVVGNIDFVRLCIG
jgi:hypothetical protein